MLGLIALIIAFSIPGFLVLDHIKVKGANQLLLGIPLSIIISGIIFYSVSLLTPVAPTIVAVYCLLLLGGALWRKSALKKELLVIFDKNLITRDWNKLLLFLLVFIFAMNGIYMLVAPPTLWDDITYHVPLIDDFAKDGRFETYHPVKNDFELRSNRYPLLFETTVGLAKMLCVLPIWKILPIIIFMFAAYLVFLISKELKRGNLWGAAIFASTAHIIWAAASYYVDIYLTLVALLATYFMIKFLKEQDQKYLIMLGVLSGAATLTKFTGIIFLVLIALFTAIKTRKIANTITLILTGALTSIVFMLHQIWQFGMDSEIGIGNYGKFAVNDMPLLFFRNLFMSGKILLDLILGAAYSPIAVILFVLALIKNDKELRLLNQIALFLFFGFIIFTGLTNSFPTYSGLPRYLFPAYGLLCVSAGCFVQGLDKEKAKKTAVLITMAFIFVGAFVAAQQTSTITNAFLYQTEEWHPLGKLIPNQAGVRVFFPTSNSFVLGLEKADLLDFQSYRRIDSEACEFLKKEKIDFVVIKYLRTWKDDVERFGVSRFGTSNFPFIESLEREIYAGKCTALIGGDPKSNTVVLKVTQ